MAHILDSVQVFIRQNLSQSCFSIQKTQENVYVKPMYCFSKCQNPLSLQSFRLSTSARNSFRAHTAIQKGYKGIHRA